MSHSVEIAGLVGTKEQLFGNISTVQRVESFLFLEKLSIFFGFEINYDFLLLLSACFCMSEFCSTFCAYLFHCPLYGVKSSFY